jgi:membrane-bound metal-dependent hydrolase YbcI (DUF457 family)
MQTKAAQFINWTDGLSIQGDSYMPFPLGHTAIGLTTNELLTGKATFAEWKTILFIAVLSNLPDLDIAAGLLIHGNGCAFHRGPTHSLAFALLAGLLAANAWRLRSGIPRLKWTSCSLVILSHVIGDLLFTQSPVSLLWPLEVHWATGFNGWGEVLMPIFFEAYRDAGIILVCLLVMITARLAAPIRRRVLVELVNYRFSGVRRNTRR